MLVFKRFFDKSKEQRMRNVRPAFVFRAVADADEERMVLSFYDVNYGVIGGEAGALHPAFGKNVFVFIVDII